MTVRAVRLPLALLAEVLWGYAAAAIFVRALGAGDGPAPSFVTVAGAVVAPFLIGRLMQATDIGEPPARLAAAAVSVLLLLALLHTEYAATQPPWHLAWVRDLIVEPRALFDGRAHVPAGIVALTLLWLRGMVRGRAPLEFDDVLSSAAVGLAAVAIAAIVAPPVRGPDLFGPMAVGYVVLALCTLALYQTADADEPIAAFMARWGIGLAALIGASATLTVIAAAVDPHSLGVLAPGGELLLVALGTVARYVFGPIIASIAFLFGLIPLHLPRPQHDVMQPLQQAPKKGDGHTPFWIQIVGYTLAAGGLLVLALSFIGLVWLLLRRQRRRTPPVAEQRRQVERDSLLGEDLAALFGGIARRFQRAPSARSSVEVRRLYHEMLTQAERDGLPRPAAATPLQFAPALDARYGSDAPSAISRAFARSRYGLLSFEGREVRELREAWERASRL